MNGQTGFWRLFGDSTFAADLAHDARGGVMESLLPIALRAFTERREPSQARRRPTQRRRPEIRWPEAVLVFDTETTTDPSQRLLFGSWRSYRWTPSAALVCMGGGLFSADELPTRDPAAHACLREYTEMHRADAAPRGDPELVLSSRTEFVNRVFYPLAYKARSLVVGFNLPFDLSRLALWAGEARGEYRGGFSLVLWGDQDPQSGRVRENRFRPRIDVKVLDSKRAFVRFTRPVNPDRDDLIPEGSVDGRPERGYAFPGHFLDARTLAFALTNERYSLARACQAFGVEHGKAAVSAHGEITTAYIDYARRDVQATGELLAVLRAEFDRHPIALPPTKAYSPASFAKAYLQAMGIPPW